MKKIILSGILLSLLPSMSLFAVKAKPGVIKEIIQPDGTIVKVRLMGDENFHYYTNLNGEPMLRNESGMLKVVSNEVIENQLIAKLESKPVQDRARTLAAPASGSWKGVGLFNEKVPHAGDQNALIILVEFSDVKFKVNDPHDYFTRFLNQEGFSDHKGTGSARDYFLEVSMGQYRPTFDVYGPVTVGTMASYGANDYWGDDKNPTGMVIDACRALDSEINFADYDSNNDGYVDNVYIIYAGQGEASYGPEDSIWPHQWELSSARKSLTLDGKKINSYGCCNEWNLNEPDGIGTFTHEFGHVLGLPDLYSYSMVANNYKATPGIYDIMDEGSYNNNSRTPPTYSAYERNAMGWIDLKVLNASEEVVLKEIGESNEACIVPVSGTEFFLFENRQNVGRDKYIPGHGMLIWHINYNQQKWLSNEVNDVATAQYVDIEEANCKQDNTNNRTMAGYPFPGTSKVTSFSDTTTPNMVSWSGKPSGITIYDIAEANKTITFKVKNENESGVNDISAEISGDSVELYNLQGSKVIGNPAPGIYIRRHGSSFEKILIK